MKPARRWWLLRDAQRKVEVWLEDHCTETWRPILLRLCEGQGSIEWFLCHLIFGHRFDLGFSWWTSSASSGRRGDGSEVRSHDEHEPWGSLVCLEITRTGKHIEIICWKVNLYLYRCRLSSKDDDTIRQRHACPVPILLSRRWRRQWRREDTRIINNSVYLKTPCCATIVVCECSDFISSSKQKPNNTSRPMLLQRKKVPKFPLFVFPPKSKNTGANARFE